MQSYWQALQDAECIFGWLMEQKIFLHLTKDADLVCGWRAFSSSAFRGIYIILQQVFSPLVDRSKDPDK